jgi:hypothetical protein
MLQKALLEISEFVKTELRFNLINPYSTTIGRIKTKNAYVPAQQSRQNIKLNFASKSFVHRFVR